MAKQYMDYGVIGSGQLPLVEVQKVHHGQVYKLTHTGEGETSPYIDRAYISFTYGGRKIQDFGLIATTVNDRVQRQSPPSHEDRTTDYKMLHGQFYWGSRYNAREMNLTLATDGMTQRQLDDFKQWFRAGEIRQLIMAEHPNRGIMARVASSPLVSIVPFTRKEWITIDEQQEQITVGQYKGTIQLSFVMDDPFWYAINSLLGEIVEDENGVNKLQPYWTNAKGQVVHQLDDDAKKVVYEDNIPTAGMIENFLCLGNGETVSIQPDRHLKWTLTNETGDWLENGQQLEGTPLVNSDENGDISQIAGAIAGPVFYNKDIQGGTINVWDLNFIWQKAIDMDGQFINYPSIYNMRSNPKELQYNWATQDYTEVQQGSYLKITDKFLWDSLTLFIFLYDKNKEYVKTEYIGFDEIGTGLFQPTYTVQQSGYIRLYLVSHNNRTISPFDNFDIRKYLKGSVFNNIKVSNTSQLPVFYTGTAPSLPEISFQVPLNFNEDGYINTFNNEYICSDDINYNTLRLESNDIHQLKITTPSIFTSYNKVISYLKDDSKILGLEITTAIKMFRNDIGHVGVRNWIIGCINIYKNTFQRNYWDVNLTHKLLVIDSSMRDKLLEYMPYLFKNKDQVEGIDDMRAPREQELNEAPYFIKNIDEDSNYSVKIEEGFFNFTVTVQHARAVQWQVCSKNDDKTEDFWKNIEQISNELNFEILNQNNNYTLKVYLEPNGDKVPATEYYYRCLARNASGILKGFQHEATLKLGYEEINIREIKSSHAINDNIIKLRNGDDLEISIADDNAVSYSWYYKTENSNDWILITNNQNNNNKISNLKLTRILFDDWGNNTQIKCILTNFRYTAQINPITLNILVTSYIIGPCDSSERTDPQHVVFHELRQGQTQQITLYVKIKNAAAGGIIWYYKPSNELNWKRITFTTDVTEYMNKVTFTYLTPTGSDITTFSMTLTNLKPNANLMQFSASYFANGFGQEQQQIDQSCTIGFKSFGNDLSIGTITSTPAIKIINQPINFSVDANNYDRYKWEIIAPDSTSNNQSWTTGSFIVAGKITCSYTPSQIGQYTCYCLINNQYNIDEYNSTQNDAMCSELYKFTVIDNIQVSLVDSNIPIQTLGGQTINCTLQFQNITNPQDTTINCRYELLERAPNESTNFGYTVSDFSNNVKTSTNNPNLSWEIDPILTKQIKYLVCAIQWTIQMPDNSAYTSEVIFLYRKVIIGYKEQGYIAGDVTEDSSTYGRYLTTYASSGLSIRPYTCYVDVKKNDEKYEVSFLQFRTLQAGNQTVTQPSYIGTQKNENVNIDDDDREEIHNRRFIITTYTLKPNIKKYNFTFSRPVPHIFNQFFNPKIVFVEYKNENTQINGESKTIQYSDGSQSVTKEITFNSDTTIIKIYLQMDIGSLPSTVQNLNTTLNSDVIYTLFGTYDQAFYQWETSNSNSRLMKKNSLQTIENKLQTSEIRKCVFDFNFKTGEYQAIIPYHKILYPSAILDDINNTNEIGRLSTLINDAPIIQVENVGDMILYNNLILQQQNQIDRQQNKVLLWNEQHKNTCHRLTYDGLIPLQNFKIYYKNLYL